MLTNSDGSVNEIIFCRLKYQQQMIKNKVYYNLEFSGSLDWTAFKFLSELLASLKAIPYTKICKFEALAHCIFLKMKRNAS